MLPVFVIDKKAKEFGEDIFGISYEAFIENNIFHIKLNMQSSKKLQFLYRLYDISSKIAEINYTNVKNAHFQITKFEQLKVRVFIKKINSLKEDYSFLSTVINYDEKIAISCLNSKSKYYTQALSSILEIIDKVNKNRENIEKILDKLHAISSFNYNILNYFKERGIDNVSVFGIKEDFELSKFIWLNSRFIQDLNIKYLLSNASFSLGVVSLPKRIGFKYTKLDRRVSFLNENDTILVCTANKDDKILNKIQKKTNSRVIHLTDVILEVFAVKFLIEPLTTIQNTYNKTKVMFCSLPKLAGVKNKSEDESKAIKGFWKNWREMKLSSSTASGFGNFPEYDSNVALTFLKEKRKGIFYMKNVLSQNVNVINNFRLTTDTPNDFKNIIYLFGNSISYGLGAEDNDTISSNLQRLINECFIDKKSYCVLNCANHTADFFDDQIALINNIHFKAGDIVISTTHIQKIGDLISNSYIICPTQQAFERPHDMGEVFIDKIHLNKIGNQKIAELLFQTMIDNHLFDTKAEVIGETKVSDIVHNRSEVKVEIKKVKELSKPVKQNIIPKEENENLKKYKELLLKNKTQIKGKIGSIVMNCNPFTLGHRYLIEQSVKKVNHLYIFVVEEDKSFFPFKDRFELVKEGTKDLKNITVIPSGRFIISSLTFEAYSNKEKLQDEIIDASSDVTIFAEELAPILDINIRFAGEEPFDNITRQYNNTMKMILPKYNIDFEVIKRAQSDNKPISASRVRKLLKDKNFDEIKKIVPKSTCGYLLKYFGNETI